jgi:hypothetical protein
MGNRRHNTTITNHRHPRRWIVNRVRPTFWCWLVHHVILGRWLSNDFGLWYVSGRDTLDVICLHCGACWRERAH